MTFWWNELQRRSELDLQLVAIVPPAKLLMLHNPVDDKASVHCRHDPNADDTWIEEVSSELNPSLRYLQQSLDLQTVPFFLVPLVAGREEGTKRKAIYGRCIYTPCPFEHLAVCWMPKNSWIHKEYVMTFGRWQAQTNPTWHIYLAIPSMDRPLARTKFHYTVMS